LTCSGSASSPNQQANLGRDEEDWLPIINFTGEPKLARRFVALNQAMDGGRINAKSCCNGRH